MEITGTITALISDFVPGLDYCFIDYRQNKKHWLINIEPIPLTEEWLLKFGFNKYKGNNKDFWLNYFEFSNNLKWIFWKGNLLENIQYVH